MSRKHIVFISLPMSGLTDEVIEQHIEEAKKWYLEKSGRDIHDVAFISNIGCPSVENVESIIHDRIWYLGWAITKIACSDEILFYYNWRKAKGCISEREVAYTYDIPVVDMEV